MATPNLNLTLPTEGGDANAWGGILNTAITAIDTWASTVALKAGYTSTGTIVAPAATTSLAPIRIPHGTAPTSPTNGDIWTTTSGVYARINGATIGPLAAAGGAVTINDDNWSGTDLAVANGGTGSSTAAGARSNLGAAASGANSDITSLTGLTTPLAVNKGGTGSTSATAARSALGLVIGTDVQAYDADLTSVSNNRILGNVSGSTSTPAQLTAAQVAALIESSLDLSEMTMGTGSGLSGEFKLGPFHFKCGNVSVTPAQSGTTGEGSVSFVDAMPTALLCAGATPVLASGGLGSGINVTPYLRGPSTSGFNVGLDQDGTGSPGALTVYWWAVGY